MTCHWSLSKSPEKQKNTERFVCDVFREHRKRQETWDGLIIPSSKRDKRLITELLRKDYFKNSTLAEN